MQSLLKVGTFEENDYCDSCESEEDSQISYEMILPCSRYTQVPHVRQLCNWDCGLACVLMVLKTLGIDQYDINSLGELCSTTSIWTVDLAFLLHKLSVCFSFLTVTLEANPDFTREEFYKEQLPNDTSRVNSLFQIAMEMGIDIQCRSISDEEICELLLSGKHIAIALVDKHKLSVSSLRDVCDSVCCSVEPGYTGHYIIICGYDADANEFEIRDPASTSKCGRISFESLQLARKSFGTDEDIILISLGFEESKKLYG